MENQNKYWNETNVWNGKNCGEIQLLPRLRNQNTQFKSSITRVFLVLTVKTFFDFFYIDNHFNFK